MRLRVAVFVLSALALTGCAARQARARGESGKASGGGRRAPLEAFIEKVRQLSLEARPARKGDAATIERTDPVLAATLVLLAAEPTAANHRHVAEEYVRLGVTDTAFHYFAQAVSLDPRDAAALDGLARIWRDWGFPQHGLGPVYRAISAAPAAPGPRNTLGTLLLALGQPSSARAAFERALALAPGAAYALNNLCYTAVIEGDAERAIDRCRAALQADPALKTARNNLALGYAASGDFEAASREFLAAGDPASERYNMGVALFATRHYEAAAAAFDRAADLRPSLTLARERAKRARDLAAAPLP